MDASTKWWKGATIYQIYPRSFADSNGDGVGDLPGITSRLDYVASLGVDAIWLSPFFKSPMKDFGYDVADYCNVDPLFGTLNDFDALIEKAHILGLRIIIDQVYSHTSDQHNWFRESRSSKYSKQSDWYVWADAKVDGSPPNNWQSVFGGPAWTWDARRQQYYMHNFLTSQPQLNVHNSDVQNALLGVARFWLERGVDGFRLDALNFSMHHPSLIDNPPADNIGHNSSLLRSRPFDFQKHIHNQSHPDIPLFLERIRSLTNEYGCCFTVAEVGGADAIVEMQNFTSGTNRLSSAYGFDYLYAHKLTASLVRKTVEDWPDAQGVGWPSWAFSNHDAPRAVSRWAPHRNRDAYARLTMLLLISLRGNIFIYQGEELGLSQVDIGFDELRDPEAIANWPLTSGRDGARTPMPWKMNSLGHDFTNGTPWLPFGVDHALLAVDQQENDAASMLALTREFIAFRKKTIALVDGAAIVLNTPEPLLVIERRKNKECLLCIFNLGDREAAWQPTDPNMWHTMKSIGNAVPWSLPAFSGMIMKRI